MDTYRGLCDQWRTEVENIIIGIKKGMYHSVTCPYVQMKEGYDPQLIQPSCMVQVAPSVNSAVISFASLLFSTVAVGTSGCISSLPCFSMVNCTACAAA